jgi:UDP-N-acetylmuramoyl-L-alanyl-D-glutamate--2,6-diaminopimelate ligase
MRQRNQLAVAMEISSHSLDQQRVADLALDVAVLTNLGRDHLDYHGDLNAYLAAKAKILDLVRAGQRRGKPTGKVVVNAADPAFAQLDFAELETVRFLSHPSHDDQTADLKVVNCKLDMAGIRCQLAWRQECFEISSPLVGRFNLANLVAALAAALALGVTPDVCQSAVAELAQVPGRMERIPLPGGAGAIVDYAHTPEALGALLQACRDLTSGRLILVFGCGGDRDRGKRPLMGCVAAQAADGVWVTSDNPRSEEPAAICEEIASGYRAAEHPRSSACQIVVDRQEAITAALGSAKAGDLVVVAGKGHEDYQLIGNQRIALDDRLIICEWVAARRDHA